MSETSTILFLGAGASACESFPTVLQFLEHVQFPDGMDARGFQTASRELARRISIAERTQESMQWPRFDAEKLWGNLELLVHSNKLTEQPFGLPVTQSMPVPGRVTPEDLLAFLKHEILRIYGRKLSPRKTPSPHQELLALLNDILPIGEPLSVFTTNYDTIIEDLFRTSIFPQGPHQFAELCTGFTDGNPGRWKPELFHTEPVSTKRHINLFKLHGSATWKWDSTGSEREAIEMDWRVPTADTDCLLYFGYKSIPETDPFKTLHNHFKQTLIRTSAVVAVGFQFADPYIRETIDFALRANPVLKIICSLRQAPAPNMPLGVLMKTFPGRIELLLGSNQTPIPFGHEEFSKALTTQLSAVSQSHPPASSLLRDSPTSGTRE